MNIKEYMESNLEKTIRNNTEDDGTLLGLPYPYTVPCPEDKFLEMYYWDTYFTNVGLIVDGKVELAKSNIDNMLYMVNKYGFMPNGNRTYYLTRSQPPFLYLGVRDIYNAIGDKDWLLNAYKTLCREYEFWQTKRVAENGLNIYGNHDFPDEQIEPSYQYFLERCHDFTTDDFEEKRKIAHTMKTFCESGWDCNSRFEHDGEVYNPVDLNSLLYGFEIEMSRFCDILNITDEKSIWTERAEKRKALMKKYMLDKERQIFLDFNTREKRFSPVVSAASVYPFFVGLCDDKAELESLFERLMLQFGVSCSEKENTKGYQWDYPNIWPPVQYISYVAALNCGLKDRANEIKDKYIKLLETAFSKTENLWEKYDGNEGVVANQDYDSPKMLGWTAGVYLFFKS